VSAHLNPGGVYYFNTTGSAAALKTAMVEFSPWRSFSEPRGREQ